MTSIYVSVSPAELIQRRHQLRRQRRIKSFRAIWRSLVVCSLTGGLVWVTTLPDWVIRKPEQIDIEGNRLLSAPTIRSLLAMPYPQSLLRLQPQVLAEKLESQASIAQATVTRQLLPPALTIQVKERQPVAMALRTSATISPPPLSPHLKTSQVGLLDAQGVWMPIANYADSPRSIQLPTLKVIGESSQYRAYWPQIYQAVSRSPVKVLEIDCQDPTNLIIKTELGIVHFGSYSSRFAYQLSVLDRLRELPDHLNPSDIAYIDLENPDNPSIQMKKAIAKTDKPLTDKKVRAKTY